MLEQLRRRRPLVALELPRLPRREDGDDPVPVLRLELLGALHEDEPHRPRRVNVAHHARDVQHVGPRAGALGGREAALLEEGADVGHAQERRGGGREEDDGVRAAAGGARGRGGAVGDSAGARVLGLSLDEDGRELPNVREILFRARG